MLNLTPTDIRLGGSFADREEAIRAIAALLADSGAVESAYVDSMLGRERTANTYLGNGVAIPHGQPQHANLIRETRVVLIQVPDGVAWKGDARAHLIFGIAARSDEHIGLLARLTSITADEDLAKRLAITDDPSEIVAALQAEDGVDAVDSDDGYEGERVFVQFTNPRGFHLRPASQLADATEQMDGKITLVVNGREADARSALKIVSLGITAGSRVEIRADSPYASDHLHRLSALMALINDEPQEVAEDSNSGIDWTPASGDSENSISGTMAAPGIAVGPAFRWDHNRVASSERKRGDEASECAALEVAIEEAVSTLRELADSDGMNKVQRNLFNAHVALVDDVEIKQDALRQVKAGVDALTAWNAVISDKVARLEALSDQHLAQRAIDLKDAGNRVSRILLGEVQDPLATFTAPVVLVAHDLEPSEAAQLSSDKVCGICLRAGSPNAHSAIVARSLGIPMVVAMGEALAPVVEGETVLLDASGARLFVQPSDEDLESACKALKSMNAQRERAWSQRYSPALTTDGHRVEVVANIAKVEEATSALKSGAEGVGLVRTEFLFLDREHAPSEEEQFECYKAMVQALEGLPMVLRTIDIGGDKPVDYLGLSEHDLSFLGLRGIRLGLARPDIIRTQLRAVYRAAAFGPIKLLFPMIATPNDFRRIRQIAESVRQEVDGPQLDLGVMIEVPAAVVMAPEIAKVADFFSVGTNDLTQYALAVDRTHPLLAKRADSLHPVVLRLISTATKAAHAEGKWVGVCGGLAADPLGAQILAGLGVDELSMPPALIPAVKEKIRKASLTDLQALATRAMAQDDAVAVRLIPPVV
ncbi:MAG TPA: phosphoenolpyruvate--protein phosphotransferase [Opitutae bacterium]|nr:phosphoenolpyruvate--protein phosphotransferase [Puniceicoccaceae bacterium]HBR94170.1 phosphoenolpyruvate--protein phosphotransferase [Opitutae bacterium]|tara:strand:- start:15842 stop:18310 length:2469 start_codon:yes stop_codon:yes gene_type:complete